jgi:hypothetical protein
VALIAGAKTWQNVLPILHQNLGGFSPPINYTFDEAEGLLAVLNDHVQHHTHVHVEIHCLHIAIRGVTSPRGSYLVEMTYLIHVQGVPPGYAPGYP